MAGYFSQRIRNLLAASIWTTNPCRNKRRLESRDGFQYRNADSLIDGGRADLRGEPKNSNLPRHCVLNRARRRATPSPIRGCARKRQSLN